MGRFSSKLIKTHRSISTIAGRTSGGIDPVRSWPNSSWCPNCTSKSVKLKAFVHSLLTTMDKKQLKNQTKQLTFNPETVFGTACWKFGTICLEVNEDISKNFQRSMKKFQKIFEDQWRNFTKNLKINKSVWRFLKIFWRYFEDALKIFEDHLKIFEAVLKVFEDFWSCFEGIWRFLKIFEGFWRFSKVFEDFWRFLKIFEGFWRFLKVFEGFWRSFCLFNCFCAAQLLLCCKGLCSFFSHSESANASSLNIQFKIQSDDCHSLKWDWPPLIMSKTCHLRHVCKIPQVSHLTSCP